MTFAITVHNSGTLHLVNGNLSDITGWERLTTMCKRDVMPVNYFADLADYRQSYNVNGKLCSQCEKETQ